MFKFLSLAFSGPVLPASPDTPISLDAIRSIVSARSHGNVRLQSGRFYTKNDIDIRYEALKGMDFTEAL